jgi:hypothetical protein
MEEDNRGQDKAVMVGHEPLFPGARVATGRRGWESAIPRGDTAFFKSTQNAYLKKAESD